MSIFRLVKGGKEYEVFEMRMLGKDARSPVDFGLHRPKRRVRIELPPILAKQWESATYRVL